MKITRNEASDLQQILNIELDDEDINPYIIKGYNKVKNRVKIPGFRPGKAPINVVEQVVGKEGMINEVIDEWHKPFNLGCWREENDQDDSYRHSKKERWITY